MMNAFQTVLHDPVALLTTAIALVLAGGSTVLAIAIWRMERQWTRRARERQARP